MTLEEMRLQVGTVFDWENETGSGTRKVLDLLPKDYTSLTFNVRECFDAIIERGRKAKEATDGQGRDVLGGNEKDERRIYFPDAAKFLGKSPLQVGGIECKGRAEASRSHGRWGLINALVERGAIHNTSEYARLFDDATVSEPDLEKVKKAVENGSKMLALFDPGAMTLSELWNFFRRVEISDPTERMLADLSTEMTPATLGNLRRVDPNHVFSNLRSLLGVDPNDVVHLGGFHEQDVFYAVKQAFGIAYQQAVPPSITLTSCLTNISRSPFVLLVFPSEARASSSSWKRLRDSIKGA